MGYISHLLFSNLGTMARRIDQIEKDLATLEEAMGAIAQELEQAYERYLAELGTVASQQLVLAAYHLCTQGYPEQFLALSPSQREEAQQALRALTRDATQRLQEALSPKPSEPDPEPAESAEPLTSAVVIDDQGQMHEEAAIAPPPASQEEGKNPTESTADSAAMPSEEPLLAEDAMADDRASGASPGVPLIGDAAPASEAPASEAATDEAPDNEAPDDEAPDDEAPDNEPSLIARARSIADTAGTVIIQLGDPFEDADEELASLALPSDPLERLVVWHERVEESISEVLQTLSYGANRLLHRAKILPNHLPDPVLEVAIKSGMTAESAGSPNLMKLMIEAKSEERDDSGILKFVVIRLRLSELEFGNPTLSSQRSQIRQLLARLQKTGKDYRKRQREKATAQAELAWRSTWHEG